MWQSSGQVDFYQRQNIGESFTLSLALFRAEVPDPRIDNLDHNSTYPRNTTT